MTTNDPAARAAPPHDPAAYSDLSGLTPRRGYLLAFIVFIVALVLVLTAWRIARDREQRSAQAEFVAQTVQVTELIQQRLVNYELVARGAIPSGCDSCCRCRRGSAIWSPPRGRSAR